MEQKHPPGRQVLLLQDSLKAQRTGEYIRTLQESGIESAFGPTNSDGVLATHRRRARRGRAEAVGPHRVREADGIGVQSRCTSRVPKVQLADLGGQQNEDVRETNFDDMGVWSGMGATPVVKVSSFPPKCFCQLRRALVENWSQRWHRYHRGSTPILSSICGDCTLRPGIREPGLDWRSRVHILERTPWRERPAWAGFIF